MTDALQPVKTPWPLWKKIVFRFFFIYLLLYMSPWDWLDIIPGVNFLLDFYNRFLEWAVIKTNANFFHVFGIQNVKQVFNGSGDTSYGWASNYFLLSIGFIGCIIWSLIDIKRKSYRQLNYLLCLFIRYSLALIAFTYGIQKIFSLQMPFPLLSQLATPLGEFLPMRFSWLFIGYSTPYEIFSGAMEVLAAVLLLYRRTATMGVLVATAVFTNVMMLNLCYDIPVKLYSINIVLLCFYLLVNEYDRIACFFILNKPVPTCSIYHYPLTRKWMRVTRIILKLGIVFMLGKTFYQTIEYSRDVQSQKGDEIFKPGVYEVSEFVVNKDTIPASITDTLRWKDVIFEKNEMGSINSKDTLFRQRYGRAYFNFNRDTLLPVINFKKFQQDSTYIFSLHYQVIDSNNIHLWGKQRNDSLYIELTKSNRHFPLAEKQFHWLSEANR